MTVGGVNTLPYDTPPSRLLILIESSHDNVRQARLYCKLTHQKSYSTVSLLVLKSELRFVLIYREFGLCF